MFPPSTAPAAALAERVRELGEVLAGFAGQGDSAADLVVLLGELETLKCRAEGAQAMAAVALDTSVKGRAGSSRCAG
jgi:ATP-dependent protease HslVU (ClpYQ) peptidase subunit